jgi:hypothetical protein
MIISSNLEIISDIDKNTFNRTGLSKSISVLKYNGSREIGHRNHGDCFQEFSHKGKTGKVTVTSCLRK